MESQATVIIQRLESLERKADTLAAKVDHIQVDLAETKGRLSQMPTMTALFAFVASIFGLSVAVVGIVFALVRFVIPLK